MSWMIFSLTCLSLTQFIIQPTLCALPNKIHNLEPDDITALPEKFPSLIDKIQQTVNRFRCPKGWKRLGGSCYYFSNITSISSHVNYTCNYLHSNLSNIMQIRNAVELFYAAHVLSRNHLSSLMIEIDPSLLKGKKISETLMNDQGRWERMKTEFSKIRVKNQNLTKNVVDQLNSAGLRILRRSRKLEQSSKKRKSNETIINMSSIINNDEYEYDDLDSSDDSDEFGQIEDIRGVCDQIHWNVLNNNNNPAVYILTTYSMSDKIVCALSDVESNMKYHHVCEYVLDFCFANIVCGTHGQCANTLEGLKCSCSFLYGGLLCEKITQKGRELIVSFVIIALFSGPVLYILSFIVHLLISVYHKCRKAPKRKNDNTEEINDQSQPLLERTTLNQVGNNAQNQPPVIAVPNEQQPRETRFEKIRTPDPVSRSIQFDLVRHIWVGVLSIFILSLLYTKITFRYYKLFLIDTSDDTKLRMLFNVTIHLLKTCETISNYQLANLIFAPFACALIVFFSFLIKRKKRCLQICDGRPGFLPPIDPFHERNRFATAIVFAILAYEVLKIFEELFFDLGQTSNHGVLHELFFKVATILLAGLRYYPVLASLNLHNVIARFLTFLYVICNIMYTIIREGSCMGFLSFSKPYTVIEEAKLRIELGTWFIIYGLIKNTPHFFFLSYIGAELCVRFAYDSIYVQWKNNRNLFSLPIEQPGVLEREQRYVNRLLRKHRRSLQPIAQQNKTYQLYFKKCINFIYEWDDDFRFTTMVTCTYTVAVVFLYYLACTFVFLYISRTTGHITFLKHSIETYANIDLGAFSLRLEIILSAVFTVIIYGIQLLLGLKQFKKDKKELYTESNTKIQPIKYFSARLMESNSGHYPGFLVGYMTWGFVICFHLILLILCGIRVIRLFQIPQVEIALGIIVPIFVLYYLKSAVMTLVGKCLFTKNKKKEEGGGEEDDKRNLKHPGSYAIYIYFVFFADCFLGIASCIIRLIKATLANVIFMARLDYSFLGRPLDKYDAGYAAYVAYLRMEINYTHPIVRAFCASCWDAIFKKPQRYYDEEWCTPADDQGIYGEPKEKQLQENITDSSINPIEKNHTNDESIQNLNHPICVIQAKNISNTPFHPRENDSSSVIIHENNSTEDVNNSNDDEVRYSVTDIMPLPPPKLQNLSLTTDKDNQKLGDMTLKQQKLDISNTQIKVEETDDEDDDGGVNPKEIMKQKQKLEEKKIRKDDLKKKKQLNITHHFIEEDEDGGMSKQKQKSKETKTKKKSIFPQCFHNQNDDDDGGPKRKQSSKKKNSKEPKKDISQEHEGDADGGPVVETYDTIKMLIPSKQPILDKRKSKDESSSDSTDARSTQSSKHEKGVSSTSVDTVDGRGSKTSVDSQNTKLKKTTDKNHYDTVPTDEDHAVQPITTNSSSIKSQTSYDNKIYFSRRLSYREAVKSPSPLISEKLHICSVQGHGNNENSHYSEITTDVGRSSVNSAFKSIIKSIRSSSKNLTKRQILTKENHTETEIEKERKKRKRIARNRWHLAYTLFHNPSLSKFRKKEIARLRFLRSQQSIQYKRQIPVPAISGQESVASTIIVPFKALETPIITATTSPPSSPETQPPTPLREFPKSNINSDAESSVESNIPVYSQILNVDNSQPTTTSRALPLPQSSTIAILQNENVNSSVHSTQTRHAQSVQA